MARYLEENERLKRRYAEWLREAQGLDEKSIDKALAAIRRFEESTRVKPFKRFHVSQATDFKAILAAARNARTGKPLGAGTIDATLRQVQGFFKWLADKPGYKSRVRHADVAYFNNTLKASRVAHARRTIPFPSMAQCARAFEAMPGRTETEQRDKAFFAFLMLTGCRIGAAISLRLSHIDIHTGRVSMDAREVATKGAKTFQIQFFPVDAQYRDFLIEWVRFLREVKLFGPTDAVFPAPLVKVVLGQGFVNTGLGRTGYATTGPLRSAIRTAFAQVQMPEYGPRSFRKTLMAHGDALCTTMTERKAWSMNLGHENIATSINAYLPLTEGQQMEVIGRMGGSFAG